MNTKAGSEYCVVYLKESWKEMPMSPIAGGLFNYKTDRRSDSTELLNMTAG